ncbi:carnitine O-acetyltransferase yat1 [Tilletia horrida]|nr:carnitine O-acetyltransferase yat1 [Tilletia horrida]
MAPVAAPPAAAAAAQPQPQPQPQAQTTTGKTFKDQDKLPKLPIPDLNDTCRRYLASLEHLQQPEEHAATKKAVDDFLANQGPKLNAQLEEYAKTRDSYIAEWWDESYLGASDSVVLNLNPFFLIEDDPTPTRGNQMMRAASLILASLSFVHDLRTGQLEPDNVRGTPLDMNQYTRLFGTARIPTADGCRLEGYGDESSHIVILRRGQLYWFEVLDQQHRPLFTERALLQNLQAVVADADKLPRSQVALNALGILTTEKRKTWSIHRETLRSRSGDINRRCLQVVDSALFVVCLDDWAPAEVKPPTGDATTNSLNAAGLSSTSKANSNGADLCNNMLCGTYQLEEGVQVGTCCNRWYDKLQIIVCSNGAAGINFEHTGVDGHTVLRFVADIYTELIMRFAKSINSATQSLFKAKTSPYAKGIGGKRPALFSNSGKKDATSEEEEEEVPPEFETAPRKLEWNLTPELRDAIRYGETRLSDLICQNECEVLVFEGYGKSFLTRHRFSPDAFVQMAFQAAYFSLYGRPATTYEPAMVKHFLRGRTEAIRTVQSHSVAFTRAFYAERSRDPYAPTSTSSSSSKNGPYRKNAKEDGGEAGSGSTANRPSPGEERIAALRKACEGHTKLTRECSKGLGHDRHLFALSQIWNKLHSEGKGEEVGEMPALFKDAGYATLNTTIISTSNCGNPALRLFGFGPVTPSGFGIGYIIKDDEIAICASSKHLQTRRYLDTLAAYLREVGALIIECYKAANSRAVATYIDHAGRECDVRTGRPLETGGGGGGRSGNAQRWKSGLVGSAAAEGGGGSNGYDDFERGLLAAVSSSSSSSSAARRPSARRGAGGSTLGAPGYGFFDAGSGSGSGSGAGAGGSAGGASGLNSGQITPSRAGAGGGRPVGLMDEIAGVGRTILFSEYS